MIRHAKSEDFPQILDIYQHARQFMRENGNPTQWGDSNPKKEFLEHDIENNNLYLIIEDDKINGVFAFIIGEDATYGIIEQGQWKSNDTYGTIHRVASAKGCKGTMTKAVEFCKGLHPYLRIDTHENNVVMQHLIAKTGFEKSGIIYAHDGTPRIAYELLP